MNKYEIVGIVGEGAYGIVYKAKNKETGEYGKDNNTLNVLSCNQEIQGEHRGRWNSQENNNERGQNVENSKTWKHCDSQRSI